MFCKEHDRELASDESSDRSPSPSDTESEKDLSEPAWYQFKSRQKGCKRCRSPSSSEPDSSLLDSSEEDMADRHPDAEKSKNTPSSAKRRLNLGDDPDAGGSQDAPGGSQDAPTFTPIKLAKRTRRDSSDSTDSTSTTQTLPTTPQRISTSSQSDAPAEAASSQAKKPVAGLRRKNKNNLLWRYFEKSTKPNEFDMCFRNKKEVKYNKAVCLVMIENRMEEKQCGTVIARREGNTTAMRSHLQAKHPKAFSELIRLELDAKAEEDAGKAELQNAEKEREAFEANRRGNNYI